MRKQEIFDTVVTHLLTQNKRSSILQKDGTEFCVYRHPTGLKCAVGVLIPDDVYDSKMEDTCASALLNDYDALAFLRSNNHLLGELQEVHDTRSVGDWPFALKKVAEEFTLEVPQILKDRLNEVL